MNKSTVNPVQKFKALLADGSRTYGTVTSVNAGDNTSEVTLQSGDTVLVKGSSYQVNNRVLIADGEIRQQVPALPFTNITIF